MGDIVRITTVIATLVLAALPAVAGAQGTTTQPFGSWIDFGARGTDLTGDGARYERYRDLGDGLFVEGVQLNHETGHGWLLNFSGEHVGRRDQRHTGRFVRPGKLKGQATWDQIPMLMSNSSRTIFSGVGSNVLTIPDSYQGGYRSNAALFDATSRGFDIKSRRHIFSTDLEYIATPALTLSARGQYTNREGVIPYGGSFGHSVLSETAAPVDHTLKDLDAGAEFSRNPVLVRVGYTASLFTNQNTTLAWDNPFNLTDTASNPSRGRGSLPPSNTYYGVNTLVSVKLPHRSRVSAYASMGSLTDAGDPIMPLTINSTTAILPLVRSTVDGKARTTAANLDFTSRPTRMVNVNVRFRSYDYDNRTPEFAVRQFDSYDATATTIASQICGVGDAICSEPFGITRQSLDASLNLTPVGAASIGVGYTRLNEDRSHRIFESTTEDVARLSFDSVGTGVLTLRTKFEHSQKRATGDRARLAAHLAEVLGAAHEQPNMRHFDVAERDRDRMTLLGNVMASGNVSVNASVAVGKDDYIRDAFIPDRESRFGLRDNTNRVVTFGVDAAPTARATVAASYSYERYKAFSTSRQASPGVQFTDQSRDWSTDATDRVHSVLLLMDVKKFRDRVDVQVTYDFNRGRAFYDYGTGPVADRTLPEGVVAPSLPTPAALPPTLSQLHRASTDLTYWATPHLGLGASYWFEDFKVEDFTLGVESTPNLLRGDTLLLGYLYRPYTANTVWGRLIYRW